MAWRELKIPNRIDVKTSLSEHTDTAIRLKNVAVTENGIETLPYWEAHSNEVTIGDNTSSAEQWLTGVTVYKTKTGVNNDIDCWLISNRYGLWLIKQTAITALYLLASPADTFLVPINHNGKQAFVFGAKDASVKLQLVIVSGTDTPFVTNMFLQPSFVAPAVNSTSIPDRNPILYRYCYTYYDQDADIESPPSPITSCYGDPLNNENSSSLERHNDIWGLEVIIPSSVDKIRIYRWTETDNAWYRIAEINAVDAWHYADTTPAGTLFTDMLNEVGTLDVVPDAVSYHNERLYVASGNIVYVSDVGRLSFRFGIDEGSDDPTLGGYVKLNGQVNNLVSWGTHVLAFTDVGCFRIIEDNGIFFAVSAPLPQPLNKHALYVTQQGLVILTPDSVLLVNKDEQQTLLPFNWELFFLKKKRIPMGVRLTKEHGKDVLDLQFLEVTSNYSAVSYIRFGEGITGEHTFGIFWGER